MQGSAPNKVGSMHSANQQSRRRAFIELATSYVLILVVCWTPRPWQKYLWCLAAASVVAIFSASFEGLGAMGLRPANFFRSLWIPGAALAIAVSAFVVAAMLGTLHLPGGVVPFIKTYWAYALWAGVQQFLLQCFFLPRIRRLISAPVLAALLAALLFSIAHLPNPILTVITMIWGFAACILFLRYRNLYPLAMAHAIFGIALAVTVPGYVDHNMRVGLGYLTYRQHRHPPAASPQP